MRYRLVGGPLDGKIYKTDFCGVVGDTLNFQVADGNFLKYNIVILAQEPVPHLAMYEYPETAWEREIRMRKMRRRVFWSRLKYFLWWKWYNTFCDRMSKA